jgi:F-type H+-transporting ATPase subunit delta
MAANASIVARRYAKALFEVLQGDMDTLKSSIGKLDILGRLIFDSKDLQTLFKSPSFSIEDRLSVLKDLSGIVGAEEQLRKFLYYFLESGRILILRELISELKIMAARAMKEDEAIVEVAFKLTAEQIRKLTTTLEAVTGRKLKMEVKLVPELLAGVKVSVAGRSFDMSLTNSLEHMKKQLNETQIPSKAMPEA